MLVAAIVPGFDVTSFTGAFVGALIVSLVSWILNIILQPNETPRRSGR
jgi:uncharacterized membrane protein YvlD (DUF360 family)